MSFTVMLYGAAAVSLSVSIWKDRKKTRQAMQKALRMFLGILPHFLLILLLTGILLTTVTPQFIESMIGSESGIQGMLLAALTGAVALVPVLAVFPIVSELLENGAGISQMAVFISTLTTVGIVTLPLEMKYLGRKAALLRNALFFLFAFVTSLGLGAVLS